VSNAISDDYLKSIIKYSNTDCDWQSTVVSCMFLKVQ